MTSIVFCRSANANILAFGEVNGKENAKEMAKAEKKAKKRVKQRNRILGSERLLPNMPFLWFTVFLAFIQTEAKKTAEEEKKICKVNIQAETAILRK